MSTTTIQSLFKVNSVLTDATSVSLATDVTRTDTGAIVLAQSTAFAHTATGVYSLPPITDPASGLTYAYTANYVYGGVTYTFAESSPGGFSNIIVGGYEDQTDVEEEMGVVNEDAAADADNTGSSIIIARRITKALAFADAFINSALARNHFATPATASLGYLRIIGAKLAAYQLYQVRGLSDKDPQKNRFQAKFDYAEKELNNLLIGNRGGFTPLGSNAPFVAYRQFGQVCGKFNTPLYPLT